MSTIDEWVEEWVDTRLGIIYTREGDIVTYRACTAFWVDGIRYDPNSGNGPAFHRTMVQELHPYDVRSATMRHSKPPTVQELDHWVRTGIFDGKRMR